MLAYDDSLDYSVVVGSGSRTAAVLVADGVATQTLTNYSREGRDADED